MRLSTSFNSTNFAINNQIQTAPLRKKEFYEALDSGEIQLNPLTHGVFAVQMGANNYKLRTIPWRACYDAFLRAEAQHHHESLHGPCKMFFDIDIQEKPADVSIWIAEFLGELHPFLAPDVSLEQFAGDFRVYERKRLPGSINAKKFSLHLIRNDGRHYASPSALGDFLRARINDRDAFFVKWGIDNKYREGNLQPIGGTKFEEWRDANKFLYQGDMPPMFVPLHFEREDLESLSFPDFVAGMVNFIPPTSVLIDSGAPARPPIVLPSSVYTGIHSDLVQTSLEILRRIEGNDDAEFCAFPFQNDSLIVCKTNFARRCKHMNEDSLPLNDSIEVKIWVKEQMAEFLCSCPPPKDADYRFLTTAAEMAYGFAQISLPTIVKLGLDRVDFPITLSELGRRALPGDWHMNYGFEDFVFHPPREGTGMMFSNMVWAFLNGTAHIPILSVSRRQDLMIGYVNLFYNELMDRKKVVIRTEDGYGWQSLDYVKRYGMNGIEEEYEKEYGRPNAQGVKLTKTLKRCFYETWSKNRRIFAYSVLGPFEMGNSLPFNSLPPSATDFTACREAWLNTPDHNPLKGLLQALWDRYLAIVTYNEKEENRDHCRRWLEKWMLSVLFYIGRKLFVNVWLVSSEHGTGKSTMFELICKALGQQLSLLSKSLSEFAGSRFNSTGNKPFVLFDDAVSKAAPEAVGLALKNLSTTQFFKSALKHGEENQQDANIMNMAFAVNPAPDGTVIPASAIGLEHERRHFAQEPLSRMQQDHFLGDEGRYECLGDCEGNGVCDKHSFSDCAMFWTLMRQFIMGTEAYRGGSLFHLFIGMLFDRFHQLEQAGEFKQSLQMTLPSCKVVEKQQTISSSLTQRWYEECLERGYTACPFGGAQDVLDRKRLLWPEDLDLDQDGEPKWITILPVQTLLKVFQTEKNSKIGEKTFITELDEISKSRRKEPLKQVLKKCIVYEYKLDVTVHPSSYKWIPFSGQSAMHRCVELPQMPHVVSDRYVQPVRLRDEGVFDLDLRHSRSNMDRSLLVRSQSFNVNSSSNSYLETQIIDDEDEDSSAARKRGRAILLRARNAVDDNAMDSFDVYVNRCQNESGNDVEEEEDLMEDYDSKEKEEEEEPRRRKQSRFIDDEAGEDHMDLSD